MADDGTQDPGPPPVLSDPVSGLVTGGRYEPEPLKVRVVEPPMPDISAVREAMAGMLDEDSELSLGLAAHGVPAARPTADDAPAEETQQSEAPTTEPSPTPPIGIPAQKAAVPAEKPVEKTAEVPVPRTPRAPAPVKVVTPGTIESRSLLPRRLGRTESTPKPAAVGRKSSAPSVTAIALLLLVIAVIAVLLIGSLMDTIASIFG